MPAAPPNTGRRAKVFAAPGHPYTRCLQLANPAMARRGARSTRCPSACRACAPRATSRAARSRRAVRCAIAECTRRTAAARSSRRRTRRGLHPRDADAPTIAPPAARRGRGGRRDATILEVDGPRPSASPRRTAVPPHRTSPRCKDVGFALQRERVRRHRRRERQRQEHAGAADRRAGDAVRRPRSRSPDATIDGSADADAHRRRHVQMVFQDPQSALNPRRRVASIVTQPLEAARTIAWEARLARAGAAAARDRPAARSRRRAFRRSSPAASASASTSRARSAPCRAS